MNGAKMYNTLLAIDFQTDFVSREGSLYVPNSHDDLYRTTQVIKKAKIDNIICTLDTHDPKSIFFPCWWLDQETGTSPECFTSIEAFDARYKPLYLPTESQRYLQALKTNNKRSLTIWPYHCLDGTGGDSLHPWLASSIKDWFLKSKNSWTIVRKGQHQLSEMYGVFADELGYNLDVKLCKSLDQPDQRIIVVGEAFSHCVIETLLQLYKYLPQVVKNTFVLIDCMSVIPTEGSQEYTNEKIKYLKTKGMNFITSDELLELGK